MIHNSGKIYDMTVPLWTGALISEYSPVVAAGVMWPYDLTNDPRKIFGFLEAHEYLIKPESNDLVCQLSTDGPQTCNRQEVIVRWRCWIKLKDVSYHSPAYLSSYYSVKSVTFTPNPGWDNIAADSWMHGLGYCYNIHFTMSTWCQRSHSINHFLGSFRKAKQLHVENEGVQCTVMYMWDWVHVKTNNVNSQDDFKVIRQCQNTVQKYASSQVTS